VVVFAGNIVSVVCDAGSHGTHVAGIVAGCVARGACVCRRRCRTLVLSIICRALPIRRYNPGQPELDGVAPGAQIVSIKVCVVSVGTVVKEWRVREARQLWRASSAKVVWDLSCCECVCMCVWRKVRLRLKGIRRRWQ
jgi:subtilisin family serine protease